MNLPASAVPTPTLSSDAAGTAVAVRTIDAASVGTVGPDVDDLLVPATAAIYLSYFDPQGAAVMPLNTPRVGPGTAVLWVVGRQDPLYREGAAYGFDRLPKNPLNAFRTVESDHISTPNAARQIVIDWLGGLR